MTQVSAFVYIRLTLTKYAKDGGSGMDDRRVYDIFKVQSEGKPVRVTSVLGLEKAKLQLKILSQSSTAKYFALVARKDSALSRSTHA